MEPLVMVSLILVAILAGVLGSLFGVGGGVILIPALTICFGLSPSAAAAVSLVGIVSTAAGSAAYFTEKKVANVRLALYLEIGTTIGAIIGALVAAMIADWILMVVFACFMLCNAYQMYSRKGRDQGSKEGEHEFWFTDLKTGERIGYDVKHKPVGSAVCVIAGLYSSMTGVGGGIIKVPLMNEYMGVPLKVSTATSSYMIGITAFSGAIIYYINGGLLMDYAAFVAVGAFIGMVIGTHISKLFDAPSLKKYFSFVLLISAITMFLNAGGLL